MGLEDKVEKTDRKTKLKSFGRKAGLLGVLGLGIGLTFAAFYAPLLVIPAAFSYFAGGVIYSEARNSYRASYA